ncbi:LysE/ArgO family amino acid transporter [Curtobacterium flaccumfaciens]|uniref:LysE/ArgO family amino acid transporter n=1 Tax=Curtobacterium flaccumfaciens TaxID=2035 RepID=UPI001BDF421A|nr:LysE family transporter [Curtobacterium flaccumfaciens]MBT1605558.1 LysE family transporter [Curtobacterium flaccumfaciens pv. betae]MBT1656337.1 LysE family transporter [Curtobacterium flaccumfaciens pv. betae]MCS0470966.1 LysE family transporter [Curtobacterium flaccumfaciens pv. betae]MCS0475214.1 LysE family transporter [Curtobacterium flaccumfaciens pv. betae]MCS0477378.1 LysE family transporter [Curtobacterium flaccumfaciens pv. betae]
MTTLLPLLSGLGTGLALIVAIGVQNTYLLRLAVSAGLRVVAAAVVVCAASDALLIVAGVLGVGAVVERFPVALLVVRFVGAAFLLTYGVLAARRALRPSGDAMRVADEAADDGVVGASAGADAGVDATTGTTVAAGRTRTAPPGQVVTMRTAVLTMLVFTWANPHVYLDTLVFLGSVANQQGADDRWLWTIGAVTASCLWFGALGFGGRLLRPLFEKPLTWRVFDGLVAVVMLAFGVLLLVGA